MVPLTVKQLLVDPLSRTKLRTPTWQQSSTRKSCSDNGGIAGKLLHYLISSHTSDSMMPIATRTLPWVTSASLVRRQGKTHLQAVHRAQDPTLKR